MIFIRRRALPALASSIAVSVPARAQNYPSQPIRLVVGTLPGSATDILARLIAPSMSERSANPLSWTTDPVHQASSLRSN